MNFDALNQQLLPNAISLLREWLPGGKVVGSEYEAATLWGGKGKSVKVNIRNGKWAEFAGDEKGNDLISLYAAIKGLGQRDAYLALGGESSSGPSLKHPKFGVPSKFWTYRSPSGTQTLLIVARYETPEGKTFLPWTPNGVGWKNAYPPEPRPLYGLDELASRPNDPVLIVEGEKAAEAASSLLPSFVVVTWPSGAKAWAKANWTPVHGRNVVLWPDADVPGVSSMNDLAKSLSSVCQSIKILDVSDYADGFDAADFTESSDFLLKWIAATPEMPLSYSFKFGTASEILSLPEPQMSWMIDGFWTDNSCGLIAGIPGVGKTWIAMDMLFAVATGQPCLGKYPVRTQSPVLLVEEEGSFFGLSRRIHMLSRGRELDAKSLSNFHHITRQFIDIVEHEKQLISFVRQRGIKFVVFDSLRQLHSVDENSSDKMKPVLASFSRLSLETGCSVLLIHHLRKDNGLGKTDKRSIFERVRGTSAIHAWRDCILGIEADEESFSAKCTFQFRDADSPEPITIFRKYDSLNNSISLRAESLEDSELGQDNMARLIEYVRGHAPCYKDEACSKAGGRKQDNGRLFDVAIKRGLVVKHGHKWDVPETAGTSGNVGT